MDTLHLRSGKFRPFMLIAPVLIALVTVAAFYNIDASLTTKPLYAGVTCTLWGTLYALSDIPFWSMTSVMTDEPQERAKAETCAMPGVNAGIGTTLLLFPYLIKFFAQYSQDGGYFLGAAALILSGVVLMLNGFFNVKERIRSAENEKITLKQTFIAVWKNKPLFFILSAFFMNVFSNVLGNLYIYSLPVTSGMPHWFLFSAPLPSPAHWLAWAPGG